jgi:hypothetical protein
LGTREKLSLDDSQLRVMNQLTAAVIAMGLA